MYRVSVAILVDSAFDFSRQAVQVTFRRLSRQSHCRKKFVSRGFLAPQLPPALPNRLIFEDENGVDFLVDFFGLKYMALNIWTNIWTKLILPHFEKSISIR